MLKHVGKQGDRKVAIVFREVPGEEHMCLVVYPDLLNVNMHDSLMKTIESPEGQAAENLGDAMHSKLFPDGRAQLIALHTEGMIKKVQTETVTVTPSTNAHVRLDELNKILREMASGKDALQRLADLDANAGYTGKASRKDDFGREVGGPKTIDRGSLNATSNPQTRAQAMQAPQGGALSDADIANNLKVQAEQMAAQAQQLIAESQRMADEARQMLGEPSPKKRGRPKKAVANAS
jgi:hypothetical protein